MKIVIKNVRKLSYKFLDKFSSKGSEKPFKLFFRIFTIFYKCKILEFSSGICTCYLCPFQADSIGDLRSHISENHDSKDVESFGINLKGIRKVFICPICQARFVHSHRFATHCTFHTTQDILKKSIGKHIYIFQTIFVNKYICIFLEHFL